MKRQLFLAAAFSVLANMALAQDATQGLIDQLQTQGYTRIEVKAGPTQTKVEAIKGSEKVETIIDNATGAVLKQETGTVRPGENTAPGVFVRNRSNDFIRNGGGGGGQSGDDDGTPDQGGGNDDDDGNDDHGGGGNSGSGGGGGNSGSGGGGNSGPGGGN